MRFGSSREIRVSDFRVEQSSGESRASALVDGERLWYSSRDIELDASPEAFGSWTLLTSLRQRRPLRIDGQVSEKWYANANALARTWSGWWKYDPQPIRAEVRPDRKTTSTQTALAFSCGVDSLHALLTHPGTDVLVAVHGFDVRLDDEYRMQAFASSVREIAGDTGMMSAVIRTNLREHKSAGRPWLWERAHGAAIASAGHTLGNSIASFAIASTYNARNQHKWGSTVQTDPLFSSDKLSIIHVGADAHREEKIRFLADNPLAWYHLRVCWENRSRSGNCSRCTKCLATMLLLAELGALDRFKVFENTASLPGALDALPYLKTHINIVERIVNRGELPSGVCDSARRLVTRSRRAAKWVSLRNAISSAVARV